MVGLGNVIYIAVKPIFKIYLIIGVGFYCARSKILTVETSRNLSSLTVLVLLPCLAFTKIVSNIDNSDLNIIGTIAIVMVTMTCIGGIGTFTLGVLAACPREWYGGLLSCGLLPNISDLPISYVQSMGDSGIFTDIDRGVSYICIFMMLQVILQFNFGAFHLIEFDFKSELDKKEKKTKNTNDSDDADSDDADSDDNSTPVATPKSEQSAIPQHSASAPPHTVPAIHVGGPEDAQSEISSLSSEAISATSTRSGNPAGVSRARSRSSRLSEYSAQHNPTLYRATTALSRYRSVVDSIASEDLRSRPKEGMNDIVRVYSRFDQVRKRRQEAVADEITSETTEPTDTNDGTDADADTGSLEMPDTEKQAADGTVVYNTKPLTPKEVWQGIKRINYKKTAKNAIIMLVTATAQPVSISLIISIVICMIPWVKALFVTTDQATIPSAPDGEPPLSFFMDFTSYIGQAQVPIGLLLLGGTIGRLELKQLPPGVWKTPLSVVIYKLFIMPIIGVAINSAIAKAGLFYNDDMLHFICNINFSLPPATSLIYITAFYSPIDSPRHLQMDLLALIYIAHYICLPFCLPFTTSYTIKKSLHY